MCQRRRPLAKVSGRSAEKGFFECEMLSAFLWGVVTNAGARTLAGGTPPSAGDFELAVEKDYIDFREKSRRYGGAWPHRGLGATADTCLNI